MSEAVVLVHCSSSPLSEIALTMAIYYKFKNEKDFGKITLSGDSMQVLALKEAIAVKKNMSMDGMDFDLVIQDVKTKEGVARPSLVVRAFARFFHVRGAWLWGRAGDTGRLATGVGELPPDLAVGGVGDGRPVIINKSARLSPMISTFCKTHCVWVGSGSIVVGEATETCTRVFSGSPESLFCRGGPLTSTSLSSMA